MPTPDETAFPPSPPIDIPARSSFPSCPPEEEREERRDESEDDRSSNNDGEEQEAAAPPADHAIAQEPTPEPDALEGASSENHNAQPQSKDRIVEDATTAQAAHTHSPTTASHEALVAPPEGEMQAQAHAASSNTHASMSFPPQYLDVTPDKDRVSAVLVVFYLGCLLILFSARYYPISLRLSCDLVANSRERNNPTARCMMFRWRSKTSTWLSRRSVDICAFKVSQAGTWIPLAR